MRNGPVHWLSCALLLLGLGACGSDSKSDAQPMTGAPPTGVQNPAGTSALPSSGASGTVATAGTGAAAGTSAASGGSAAPSTTAGTTAGTAGTGTSAPTAGSGGAAGPALMDTGSYYVSGDWHGYAFATATGTGSTITPADFSMLSAGQPRCIKGSVAATTDYSGIAMIGLNLNQAQSMGAPLMTVVPKRGGLDVSVTNNASSPLRLQVQGPNGASDANDRWCAVLSGSGGFIPWSMFNTACWDGTGMPYAMQPLAAAMVLVPGDMTSAIAFDFCLNSLAEGDGSATGSGGAGGAGGTPAAAGSGGAGGSGTGTSGSGGPLTPGMNVGSGTLTDRYASAMVMRDGRNYVVQNNVWGNTSMQTVKYDGTTFEIMQQTGMNVASGPNAGAPVSYPSAFIGSNNNRATTGSNLPKQVSALKSVKTGWSHNGGSAISGTYNAAYDVWFSTGAGGDSAAPSGGYLMVWYYKPSDAQPIGMRTQAGVAISGADGSWDVWLGQNGGKPCISYVRTSATTSMQYDLNAFIKDATGRPGAIQSSWYLSNVFAGFEIWNGGVGLKTSAFYAIVE